jgi:hypothetical protein
MEDGEKMATFFEDKKKERERQMPRLWTKNG